MEQSNPGQAPTRQSSGPMTATEAVAQRPLSAEDYEALRTQFHANCEGKGVGYLAVALHNKAGWSAAQIAEFLAISPTITQEWLNAYATRGLNGLQNLQVPNPLGSSRR